MGLRESDGPLVIPGHGAGTNPEHRHGYGRGVFGGTCRGEACLSRCLAITQRRKGRHSREWRSIRRSRVWNEANPTKRRQRREQAGRAFRRTGGQC